MVSKIKLVIILELLFNYRVFEFVIVKLFHNPCLEAMNKVDKPESIRYERQLNYKLDVKVLLRHKIYRDHLGP